MVAMMALGKRCPLGTTLGTIFCSTEVEHHVAFGYLDHRRQWTWPSSWLSTHVELIIASNPSRTSCYWASSVFRGDEYRPRRLNIPASLFRRTDLWKQMIREFICVIDCQILVLTALLPPEVIPSLSFMIPYPYSHVRSP